MSFPLISKNKKIDIFFFFPLLLEALKMEREKRERERAAPTDTSERGKDTIFTSF